MKLLYLLPFLMACGGGPSSNASDVPKSTQPAKVQPRSKASLLQSFVRDRMKALDKLYEERGSVAAQSEVSGILDCQAGRGLPETFRQALREAIKGYAKLDLYKAHKARSPALRARALRWFGHYFLLSPPKKEAYAMYFWQAETLYALKRFPEALAAYERSDGLDPRGRFSQDALYAVVLLHQRALDAAGPMPRVGPLPASAGALLDAGRRYIQRYPRDPRAKHIASRLQVLFQGQGLGREPGVQP